MTTPATLARALAYLAITGGKSCLNFRTKAAMYPYYELVSRPIKIGDTVLSNHVYELNAEGRALAEKSKLWAAHAKLIEMGFQFKPVRRRRQSSRFLSYDHREHMNRQDMRGAFIASDSAYAQAAPGEVPEGNKGWEYLKVEV